MGIKGLTNRELSFPEIGQVRKGAPKNEKGQLGKDLTYFRVEFDEREAEAEKVFRAKYGNQPQELNILLPFDDIERTWDAWLEAYTAGRMVARSDGEKFLYLVDTKTGEMKVKDGQPSIAYKPGPVGTYTDGKGKEQPIECKPVGRLKVVIPELQRLAYMTVMTTSVHDIANISAQLEALKTVNNGRLAGIPMVLRRRPKKISTPKPDGTRARYTKWMLSIEADPGWVRAKLLDFKHAALPGNGLDLLPAGEDTIDSEPIEMDQDIYDEMEEDIPSEPEMEDEPKPNGRPYEPEVVRQKIQDLAEKFAGNKASKEQYGLMVGMMDICFAGEGADLKRHEACNYLTGTASSKSMKPEYVLALLEWLKPQKIDDTGEYQPDGMAIREAQAIITARLEEVGQEKLF
jgi:hypothetical protein